MSLRQALRRRRQLDDRQIDLREIVVVNNKVMSCDEFKALAEIRMAPLDALPAAYRAVVNDFNLHVGDVITLMRKGKSPDKIRAMAEAKVGRPI